MSAADKAIQPNVKNAVEDKFRDLMTPGYVAEFSPDEADLVGAFEDDALSTRDAYESAFDTE
jgi:hypothetical protein